jgi:predicted short-subunit dehydrogenase-like oxidoreductase (DUF2520 family)
VVSAGRVGAVLGAALRDAGHRVVAVSGVSERSRRRAEELLVGVPLEPPDEVAAAADLVLLAIPDDALAGTLRGLVGCGAVRPGQIVAHTSGAHGVSVLEPAERAGALTLALHPVMTFTGRSEDLRRLASCSFGVTAGDGNEPSWHVAEALVMEMGAEPVRVPEAVRPLYHAALTHGANHLVTLVNDAVDTLRSAGVEEASRLLAPLLSAALDNALRHGDAALTGPVARGDTGTLATHRAVLAEQSPEMLPTYLALARRTAARAEASGTLRPEAGAEVREELEDG